MVLIIGGTAQGKLDFARRELGVAAWSDGAIGGENCIYNLHLALRQQPEADAALEAWLEAHPEGVVICGEVGCGVVPMDREERAWRERVGRTCCRLAERASAVYRVTCGLGARLK